MFRFTIRDVLWLTVLVGLLALWWFDRQLVAEWGRAKDLRAFEESLEWRASEADKDAEIRRLEHYIKHGAN